MVNDFQPVRFNAGHLRYPVGEWLYLIDLTFGLYDGLCSIPSRSRFLLNFNNPFKLIKLVLIKRQVGIMFKSMNSVLNPGRV
jgi:hypothetical protein